MQRTQPMLGQDDLCRVTVVSPAARVDVALPAHAALIDVIPALVRHSGAFPDPAAEQRVDPLPSAGTWSLQRLGDPALDVAQTAAQLGLRDGEILYLRPVGMRLPELAYDDVADAIATATAQHTSRWTSTDSRRAGLIGVLLVLAVLAWTLRPGAAGSVVGGTVATSVAVGLLALGAVLSRAVGDARAAAAVAAAGVWFSAQAGGLLVAGSGSVAATVAAGGCAAVGSVLALVAVGSQAPVFVATALVAVLAVLTGDRVAVLVGVAATGALAATTALALTQVAPGLAMRLADLPLPQVPFTAEEIRQDEQQVDGPDIVRRAQLADEYVTAVVLAAAAALLAGLLAVGLDDAPGPVELSWLAVLSIATALRARSFGGRWQRAGLLVVALLGAATVVQAWLGTGGGGDQVRVALAALVLLVGAALLLGAAVQGAGRTVSPVWRRMLDLLDAAAVVSLVPLALGVLGAYGYVRGLSG